LTGTKVLLMSGGIHAVTPFLSLHLLDRNTISLNYPQT
jgi:hypothetical protein